MLTYHTWPERTRVGFQLIHPQIDRARRKSRPAPAAEPPLYPPLPPWPPQLVLARGGSSGRTPGPHSLTPARAAPFESACARRLLLCFKVEHRLSRIMASDHSSRPYLASGLLLLNNSGSAPCLMAASGLRAGWGGGEPGGFSPCTIDLWMNELESHSNVFFRSCSVINKY